MVVTHCGQIGLNASMEPQEDLDFAQTLNQNMEVNLAKCKIWETMRNRNPVSIFAYLRCVRKPNLYSIIQIQMFLDSTKNCPMQFLFAQNISFTPRIS